MVSFLDGNADARYERPLNVRFHVIHLLLTKQLLPRGIHNANVPFYVITDQIETVGDRPLRKILDDLGGWPVVTAPWDGRPWDLIEVLAGMRGLYNAPILIDAWVAADDKNSSVNIIVVSICNRAILKTKVRNTGRVRLIRTRLIRSST